MNQLKRFLKKQKYTLGLLVLVLVVIVAIGKISGTRDVSVAADLLDSQKEDSDEMLVMGETYGVVYLDGVAVASLSTYEEAQSVLDGVLAHFMTKGSEIVDYSIRENIEAREVIGAPWNPMTVKGAVSLIVNGTEEVKTYTVVKGDTMYGIADKVGMAFSKLVAANPAVTPSKLNIGQDLNIVEVKPMVHVNITEKVTETEYVSYSTTYESSDSLYIGQYQLKSSGRNGKNEVDYLVTSENGKETSREKLDTRVVSEPVTQVTYKGTKALPNVMGTGVFRNPLDGKISVNSGYGIYRGSGYGTHKGVDLAAKSGDNIYAVDDGVVTFSGTSGTYGNLVKLSHGNGYETYYAHCSKLLVSVGDTVKKGDVIALVGSTGRSTGPHLHFEVRLYGAVKNPLSYLP